KIDAAPMPSKVSDDESRCINLPQDLIVDSIDMLDAIHPYGIVARLENTGLKSMRVCLGQLILEPHGHEPLSRTGAARSNLVQLHVTSRQNMTASIER